MIRRFGPRQGRAQPVFQVRVLIMSCRYAVRVKGRERHPQMLASVYQAVTFMAQDMHEKGYTSQGESMDADDEIEDAICAEQKHN